MYREPTDPPLELSASDMPRRPKTGLILGGFVLLVGAVGAGLFFADKRDTARKQQEVQTAFGKLSTCLLGEPLGNGEKASARFRAIQLAIAEADPKGTKEPATEVWPFRCHAQTQALIHVLNTERLAKEGSDDLAARTDKLAQRLIGGEHEKRLADFSEVVDGVWAKASESGIAASKHADVKPAPAPAKPLLSIDELRKHKPLAGKPISIGNIKSEIHRHRDLTFAVADSVLAAPMICSAAEGASTVTCKKLPAEAIAVGGEPLLEAARDPGAAPVVMFGPQAAVGAWATDDGAAVVRGEKFGWAYHRADGSAVTLTYRDEDKKLKLAAGKNALPLTLPGKVKSENLFYATALVPGFALFRGANDDGRIRLFARALDSEVTTDVGEIGGWYTTGHAPQFMSCHTGDALVVAVKGHFSWYVTVHRNGNWTVPARVDHSEQLTCRKGEATFTTASAKDGVVRQWKCANGICDIATASLPALGARKVVTTDTGVVAVGRVLDRGGVHLHAAPIDQLGMSKGAPLLDDLAGGRESVLRGFEILPFGSAAALIFSTTEGTFVVRVDGDGKVTPLDVEQGS